MPNIINKKLVFVVCIIAVIAASIIPISSVIHFHGSKSDEITGLTAEQEGFDIKISWDEVKDSSGYSVLIYHGLGVPDDVNVDINELKISEIEIGEEYSFVVSSVKEDGSVGATQSISLVTEKLEQKVAANHLKIDGFVGNDYHFKARGEGNATVTSDNEQIVTIDESGNVQLVGEGEANLVVSFEETDIYRSKLAAVPVTVYPEKLTQPELSITDKSNTDITLEWDEVKYAKTYKIMKRNPATGKYELLKAVHGGKLHTRINRELGKYKVQACLTTHGRTISSDLSKGVSIEPVSNEAKAYSKAHNLMKLDKDKLDTVALIHGTGSTKVPQSMSFNGKEYIISYVNHGGSIGKFVAYNTDGKLTRDRLASGMGHANGATYNKNTGKLYVVKTHKNIKSSECNTYNEEDFAGAGAFNLPKVTSGIAYDPTTNHYYLSKGNEIYVTDDNFKVQKFIHKSARYNHAQDIGGYNGVVMVCTWVSGKESYIDLYRAEDGAYLGSYYVPLGEIESCLINDGYLVILMNIKGTNDAYIYKTKERVALP